MRRRDFMAAAGAATLLPMAAWSRQSTAEGASDIPLSYDDARFSGNALSSTVKLSANGAISNKSITETGDVASIMTGDGATIRTCRVNSRECVRIGGRGTFLIDQCYLEARGEEGDHADVIQTYSPGNRGTLKVSNTAIVSHDEYATSGLFIADNWTGTLELENVAFIGGGVSFGLRVHPDVGGDNIIRMKNVFFIPPFRYAPYFFSNAGGRKNILELWENVRWGTIAKGRLAPGPMLPRPIRG
jgi:hypothetical protein